MLENENGFPTWRDARLFVVVFGGEMRVSPGAAVQYRIDTELDPIPFPSPDSGRVSARIVV